MTVTASGSRTDSGGGTWKRLDTAEDGFALEDFDISNYGGVLSLQARGSVHRNVTVARGVVRNVDRVITMPYGEAELDGFLFEDIRGIDLERGFMRLKKARNGVIRRVTAYQRAAGTTQFADAFATTDHPTHNILFDECEAYGFDMIVPDGAYPNGGGFSDEERSSFHRFRKCLAADGNDGFDLKSKAALLQECVASRNRRNFRFWGNGTAVDCVSSDPTNAHFWFGGGSRLGNWTLVRPVFIRGGDIAHITVESATEGVVIEVVHPLGEHGYLKPGELKVRQIDSGRLAKVVVRYHEEDVVEPEPEVPPTPEPEPEVPSEPGTPPTPEPEPTETLEQAYARAKKIIKDAMVESAKATWGGSTDKTRRMQAIHAILGQPLPDAPAPSEPGTPSTPAPPATRRLSFTLDGVTYVGNLDRQE